MLCGAADWTRIEVKIIYKWNCCSIVMLLGVVERIEWGKGEDLSFDDVIMRRQRMCSCGSQWRTEGCIGCFL